MIKKIFSIMYKKESTPCFSKYKVICSIILFSFFSNIYSLDIGNSAWVYSSNTEFVNQIKNFNLHNKNGFKYLFVKAGSVRFKKGLLIRYTKKQTCFYKKQLPGVKIISNLAFWVKGTGFYNQTASEYKKFANIITNKIIADKNSDGVFLDLERYNKRLIPFYIALSNNLKHHNKILAVIVSPGDENKSWFNVLPKNSIVVLYGYDLHHNNDSSYPVSPSVYKKRLEKAVHAFVKVSEKSKVYFMVGVPAIATTYEWERKTEMTGEKLYNKYMQSSYLLSSINICNSIKSKYFLGFSVWAFINPKLNSIYSPMKISRESWRILQMN